MCMLKAQLRAASIVAKIMHIRQVTSVHDVSIHICEAVSLP